MPDPRPHRIPGTAIICPAGCTAHPEAQPFGTLWEYADARGVVHRGVVTAVYDHGGTDVTHAMMAACGTFAMLSGSRLRAATVDPAGPAECAHGGPPTA